MAIVHPDRREMVRRRSARRLWGEQPPRYQTKFIRREGKARWGTIRFRSSVLMANYTRYGFQAAVKKPYLLHEISKALNALLNDSSAGKRGKASDERP